MGYSSEVTLAFSKKGYAKLLGYLEDFGRSADMKLAEVAKSVRRLLDESDDKVEKDGNAMFHWKEVEWDYRDKSVMQLMKFCETRIEEEDWSLLRIGEEFGDSFDCGFFIETDESPFYIYPLVTTEYGIKD